jgi:phage-related minor tail protein
MADEVKGYSIYLSLNSDNLNKGLKSLSSDLSSTEKKLKDVNKQLHFDPKNINLLNQKQNLLNVSIEKTKEKLALQNKELSNAAQLLSSGKISQTEFDKISNSVSKTSSDLGVLNGQLKQTVAQTTKISGANWDKISSLGSSLSKLTTIITGTASALAALTVAGWNSLSTISDNAAAAGITASQYQKLVSAANSVGVSTQTLQSSLSKLSGVMVDLSSGNGADYEKELNKIGLSYKDLAGMDSEEAFKAISTAMASCTDETTRLEVAQSLFGTELGNKIIPLIEQGGDAISDLEDNASSATDEEIQAAKEATTALSEMKNSLTTIAGTVAKAVLPYIKELTNWIKDTFVPAIKTAVEWITNLDEPTKKIIAVIGSLVAVAGPVLTIVGKLGKSISTLTSGVSSLLGGSGTGLLGLVAAHPVIAAALAALVATFAYGYKNSDEFRSSLDDVIASLKELVSGVLTTLIGIFDSIKPALTSIMSVLVKVVTSVMPLVTSVLKVITSLLEELSPEINSILSVVSSVISVIVTLLTPVLDVLKVVFEFIGDILEGLFDLSDAVNGPAIKGFSSILNKVAEALDSVNTALKPISDWFDSMYEKVHDAIEKVKDFFTSGDSWFGKVKDWFSSIGSNISDWWNSTFGSTQISSIASIPSMQKATQSVNNSSATNNNNNQTYNVTINTTSDHMTINDLNKALGSAAY